jgi:NAD+ synthase (glutamine-hydrolysing)
LIILFSVFFYSDEFFLLILLLRRVISLVDKAEYKRRQYPPGTKVSGRAFGKDLRLPITSGWIEQ